MNDENKIGSAFKDLGTFSSVKVPSFSEIVTPTFDFPEIDYEEIENSKNERAGRFDAELVYEYLQAKIENFQNGLDEDHEIGIQLANFGIASTLHIRSIGFRNPNLIEFGGLSAEGQPVELVQHVSQLNFMLSAVPPVQDAVEPYRVGFVDNSENSE